MRKLTNIRKVLILLFIFMVIGIGISSFSATRKEKIKDHPQNQPLKIKEEIKPQNQQLANMKEEIKQLLSLNWHSANTLLKKENERKIARILDQIIVNDLNEKDEIESVNRLGIGKKVSFNIEIGNIRIDNEMRSYELSYKLYKLTYKKFLIVYTLPLDPAGSLRETFVRLVVKDNSKYKLVSTSEEVKRFNTEHYKVKTQTREIIQPFSRIDIYSIEPLSETEFLTFGRIIYWRSIGIWQISDNSLELTDVKFIPDYFAEIRFNKGKIYIYYPKYTKIPGKGITERNSAFIEIYSIEKGLFLFEDKKIGEETELIKIMKE